MPRKYDAKMKVAIDVFWQQNKYPPTLRDLMKIVGISSTSVCRYVIRHLDGVRIAKNGRVIPLWVDNLFCPTPRAPDLWDSAPLPLLSTPEADTPAGHLSTPPTSR